MTFDAETHIYTLNGVEYPSVTTILKNAGIIDTRFYNEKGRDRGTVVHELTAMIDADELDADDVSDHEHWEYIEAWEMFKFDYGFAPIDVEKLTYSTELFYAGTIDRIGYMDGELWVIDLKTGRPEKWHSLQSAAYVLADAEQTLRDLHKYRRGTVHLNGRKNPLIEHEDAEDLLVWKYSRMRDLLCKR